MKKTYKFKGIELSNEEALNKIIINTLLYQKAIELGIMTSEKELDNYIKETKSAIKEDEQVKLFYKSYLQG